MGRIASPQHRLTGELILQYRPPGVSRDSSPGADISDVARLLDEAERAFGDRVFLRGDQRLTYRQSVRLVRRIAGWLARQGVGPGDRVLIVAPNRNEVVLLSLAAVYLGAITTIIHESTKPRVLKRIVELVQPAVAAFDRSTIKLSDSVGRAVVVDLDSAAGSDGPGTWEQVTSSPDDSRRPTPVRSSEPAHLIFTSGSTGDPRGVIVTHDNIVFSAAAIQERLTYRTDDVVGLYVPLSFDYGLYQIFLVANVGATLRVGPVGSAGPAFLHELHENRITVLPAVPGMLSSLHKLLGRGQTPLPDLRSITSTGEYLPESGVDALRHRLPNASIFPMYGLTECKRVSILLPQEWEQKRGTVGRPLRDTAVRVVGADGRELPRGCPGELVVSGRHVTQGYWRATGEDCQRFRPAEADPSSRELWTGDIGQIDGDGYIRVLGRRDSLLKHHGFRISGMEIEREANAVSDVIEAGAVSAGDGTLHLFVRLASPDAGTDELRRALRDNLEWFKLPDRIHVVGDLPRTGHGKIDRAALTSVASGTG